MNRRHLITLLTSLAALAIGSHSVQADPVPYAPGSGEWTWRHWCHPGVWGPCCCPDDYCPKKMPCPPPCAPCGCVDDYCPKKMPCPPPCAPRGCVDDYCPKKMPVILPPVCGPCHTCGPPDPCECPKKGGCPIHP